MLRPCRKTYPLVCTVYSPIQRRVHTATQCPVSRPCMETDRDPDNVQGLPLPTTRAFVDSTGDRWGNVEALAYGGQSGLGALWICLCDCGNTFEALGKDLRRFKITSCGLCSLSTSRQRLTPALTQALRAIGTPPCELKSICNRWGACAEHKLACLPFYDWAMSGGRVRRNLKRFPPNRANFDRLFPGGEEDG